MGLNRGKTWYWYDWSNDVVIKVGDSNNLLAEPILRSFVNYIKTRLNKY